MAKKPTYEELEQRVKELENEAFERKQAEKVLKENELKLRVSEQELNSILHHSPDIIYRLDPKGVITYVNDTVKEYGYSKGDLLGKNILEFVHPDDREKAVYRINERRTGDRSTKSFEVRLLRKDHAYVHFENKSRGFEAVLIDAEGIYSPENAEMNSFLGTQGIARDIFERRRAETALQESEEKFRSIFENKGTATGIFGEDSIIRECNAVFEELSGYAKSEIFDKMKWSDLVVKEDLERMLKYHAQRSKTEDPSPTQYECGIINKKGEIRNAIVNVGLVGKNRIVSLTDITSRKQAEEALRESEERFRLISEQSLLAIGVIQDGHIIYANEMYSKLTGYSLEEIYGWEPYGYARTVHKDHLPFVMKQSRKKQAGDEDVITNYQFRGFTKSKEIVWWDLHSNTITYHGRPADLFTLIDITEKVESEKERAALQIKLQHSQKMEAIGTLAGGVAHDLNNILGGLVSYPELLLLQLPLDSPLRKSILTIQKSGEKAAAVVQDLLTLARRGVVVTEVVNVNEVIAEYLQSPEHENLQSVHPGVHMETHLEKDTLNILGSSTHLSKTVMNLVSNAAEAMPEGGALTVSTENRYIDRPIGGYDNVKEGDYVVLTISDTGTGISPNDINKIFEPFYTKKKMGRSGTGLGMAVVWGTVKDHNGYIDVQSVELKGTTFTLYFPVTREKLSEDKSHFAVGSYSGDGESILVIDDVEEQRNIASGMLKELGYSVAMVSSGEEAVEYLKTNKADLLLLDMIMDPGMDGLDTYKKILEIHPEQKAIIASGFSETNRVKAVQSLGAGAYIRKPLLLHKIGVAVKDELEK